MQTYVAGTASIILMSLYALKGVIEQLRSASENISKFWDCEYFKYIAVLFSVCISQI